MKIYKELYVRGSAEALQRFQNKIGDCASGDWLKEQNNNDKWSDYLIFSYYGNKVDHAKVFFYIKNAGREGNVHVGNIIPTGENKNELTIEEYNNILDLFYEEVICLYNDDNINIELSIDSFDPLTVMSQESLSKLTLFTNCANKSTGSIHPCDRERWFDFIFTSFNNGEKFDEETFAKFLSDKEYWGVPNGYIMGKSAWTDDKAWELAMEYSLAIEVLEKYTQWKDNL